VKRALWILGAVLIIAACLPVLSLYESYRGFEKDTFLELQRGTGTIATGRMLAQQGVIRYPWQFWLARTLRPGAKIQAGEYRFNQPATVGQVFDRLARGDVYYFEVNIPEGSNMFDTARLLEEAGAFSADEFLAAARDTTLIHDLAPKASSLEGYLFPATYRLTHSTTAPEMCRRMTEQFRKVWTKLSAGKDGDPEQVVTLASLVEKETGIASERPLIAGVFANRLKIGMRLECDPTTIYAALLENRFRHAIHQSDLASQNPYNTYQHAGLPPGPIANPGADSIAAALEPAETKFLYFVAKASGGGHQFSSSLAEHQKATSEYRHGNGSTSKKARKAG
jgi:UPF0755 protein